MRRGLFLIRILLPALALLLGPALSAAAPKPNVLLICVDDLKPQLGCYGDTLAHSPNIDRLAARGMVFTRAYCNQAVCGPSRNSLLTGLRPASTGIYDLGTNIRQVTPDVVTLPQFFKQQGYLAEGLGKVFHIGHGNLGDPVSWSVPFWKEQVIAYALPESGASGGPTREEAFFANDFRKPINDLPKGAAWEAADVPDEAYPDGRIAAEAIKRLQAAKTKPEQPFFLAVGFVKPHLPFCAPKKYWDLYDRSAFKLAARQTAPDDAPPYAPQFNIELPNYRDIPGKRPLEDDLQRTLIHGYYAAMSYMDAQLGKVLDELDRLGLANNTVVVLWGDNGWHLGDHGMWCKHTNYEQAARIPVIIAAPGIAKPGTRSDALIETVDIFPTLRELAGLKTVSVNQPLDGTSLVPLLKRRWFAKEKEAVFHAYPRGNREKGPMIGRALRTERYRLVEWKVPGAPSDTADLELYDYRTDPEETRNLAAEQPKVVAKLRAILAKQPEAKPQWRGK
jgi:iduronate 2-sulfatase